MPLHHSAPAGSCAARSAPSPVHPILTALRAANPDDLYDRMLQAVYDALPAFLTPRLQEKLEADADLALWIGDQVKDFLRAVCHPDGVQAPEPASGDPDWLDFWTRYPNWIGDEAAVRRAYQGLTQGQKQRVRAALTRWLASKSWADGFTPAPLKFLSDPVYWSSHPIKSKAPPIVSEREQARLDEEARRARSQAPAWREGPTPSAVPLPESAAAAFEEVKQRGARTIREIIEARVEHRQELAGAPAPIVQLLHTIGQDVSKE